MNQRPVGCLLCAAAHRWDRGGARGRQRGFTLIELIMVLVLLGVLAVFAAPRILNRNDFEARGFHDQTLGVLRFAQKTAIAQRRSVCVAFTANTITLTIANAEAIAACAVPLNGPTGLAVLTAPANVTYTAAPANFRFDGLGQPLTGANTAAPRTINVTNAAGTISVEAATGYVHD
ncbi:MAG: prepilin-type N-terminal cleavage/methylation domain-containing protein [Rhodoferax sp.]|nr:prepilin-type N-terminal cleavage/methylation domain-containing protein [Rhodoferax sp.]